MDLPGLLPSLPQFKMRKRKPPSLLGSTLSRAAGGSWTVPQGRAEGACLWVLSTHPSWRQVLVSLPHLPCTSSPVTIFFLITAPASSRPNWFSVGMLLRTWDSHQTLNCFDCLWLLGTGLGGSIGWGSEWLTKAAQGDTHSHELPGWLTTGVGNGSPPSPTLPPWASWDLPFWKVNLSG